MPISKETFEQLSPRDRGYTVYMAGCRDDQPNIPDESNPYPPGTMEHAEWDRGQQLAVLATQDIDE